MKSVLMIQSKGTYDPRGRITSVLMNGRSDQYINQHMVHMSMPRFVMALQNAFRHLLPILYDDSDPDYIPTPVANSTTAAEESSMDIAFLDVISDANRVLIDDVIPAIPPQLSDEEDT